VQIGPLQLVVIGFDNDDHFRGQILAELAAVRGRGTIRLLDALFIHKDDAGDMTVVYESDLGGEAQATYGRALKPLLGLADTPLAGTADGGNAYGISAAQVRALIADMPAGSAVAVVLFEHAWAAPLSAAVQEAGGRLLAQGMLTRDAVLLMGEELRAIAAAEAGIAAADAVRGAALLDALAFAEELQAQRAGLAAAVTTSVAAEVVRSLIVAGVIDDDEVEPALAALVGDGLLDVALVAGALQAAVEAEDALRAGDAGEQ
jgi:hypothetical protein